MKKRLPIALVVHGHFYQPPRENPWTDEVPREPSAAPFHDWYARIHAECYRANAYARIYGPRQHVASIVNNYASTSFDIGPTLARWLSRHDDQVMRRIRQGNEDQRRRLGAGGAMAQVWAHPIAPLLSPRDLRTQIRWGQVDFRLRFGHDAAGMWLPVSRTRLLRPNRSRQFARPAVPGRPSPPTRSIPDEPTASFNQTARAAASPSAYSTDRSRAISRSAMPRGMPPVFSMPCVARPSARRSRTGRSCWRPRTVSFTGTTKSSPTSHSPTR